MTSGSLLFLTMLRFLSKVRYSQSSAIIVRHHHHHHHQQHQHHSQYLHHITIFATTNHNSIIPSGFMISVRIHLKKTKKVPPPPTLRLHVVLHPQNDSVQELVGGRREQLLSPQHMRPPVDEGKEVDSFFPRADDDDKKFRQLGRASSYSRVLCASTTQVKGGSYVKRGDIYCTAPPHLSCLLRRALKAMFSACCGQMKPSFHESVNADYESYVLVAI